MNEQISYELAQAEVEKWLSKNRIKSSKRKASEPVIESLIEAVMYGQLVFDENLIITQNLDFPLGEDGSLKSLTYKERITKKEVDDKLSAMKNKDGSASITAYVAALTLQPVAIIDKLDTRDYSISQSIAVFFI